MRHVHQQLKKAKKLPVVILHGWKLRGEKYIGLKTILEKNGHKVLNPDMPGFGTTPLTSQTMSLNDYSEYIKLLLGKHKIEKAVFIGHSFGGRVAIKFAHEYPEYVELLILTGVPIIRHMTPKKRVARFVAFVFKTPLKIVPVKTQDFFRKVLYYSIGEWDYYNAGDLRPVFKNIISEDLQVYLKNLRVPILFLWGEKDKFTPVDDIEKLKQLSPQAEVFIFQNIGHGLPYVLAEKFYKTVEKYL